MKKEDLKTRPDLNDEQYLAYLVNLPENNGIDVRGLYLDMHEWCAKKRKTPNRKRLLNWIARERDSLPMTMLPTTQAMTATEPEPSLPDCNTCNNERFVKTEINPSAQYDWARYQMTPCPDCKKEKQQLNG